MLNIPSPYITPRPPLSPLPPRRRGGQPSNRNARTHGFYSRQPPAPLAKLSHALDSYRQIEAERDPLAIARSIPDLGRQIDFLAHACQILLAAGKISLFVVLQKLFHKTINLSMRYKLFLHRYLQPFNDLQYVAGHPLDLISYGFWEHRITRDADSFRSGLQKSDLNSLPFIESLLPLFSEPDFPFLIPRQTQLLQPLLPAPNGTDGSPLSGATAGSVVEGSGAAASLPSPNPQDLGLYPIGQRGRGWGCRRTIRSSLVFFE